MWSKEIQLSTEKSLEEEEKLLDSRLNFEGKKLQDRQAISKLKQELDDLVSIEAMPLDVQEQFVRAKLNIAPHDWDVYDAELKGKTIAIEVIKAKLEKIHKFYHHMEQQKKNATKPRKN